MRNIKELLELMLKNKNLFTYGLCGWCLLLYVKKMITVEERSLIEKYIKEHRVSKYSSFNAYNHRGGMYWWKKGDIEPRIKWIKKHIKKLSKI